ncbi:Enhancer of mRNA-decapping protein 4 [Vitis vinifera]|uniref:Enhancer of mRNA-decapping protein 4 n=1 Tax=Vitis vinifera TaxID=29760 RepID=A0A438ER18_VITVI|nr:Enhancer of mRNA-decapping protein 4 [Vitis vinifera]
MTDVSSNHLSPLRNLARYSTQIKIWEDRKTLPLLVLRPHDGHPVNSATFLTAPHRPDHIILITAGSEAMGTESEEGWLLPSDAESWHCTQTLDLKSSAEPCVEEAFFNQVLALSKSGLLLLANAKRMLYMLYIWSMVYCFQTQAIQQYALNLSQCLPLLPENVGVEKSDSGVSHDVTNAEGFGTLEPPGSKLTEMPLTSSALKSTVLISSSESEPGVRFPVSSASIESATLSPESKPGALPLVNNDNDIVSIPSPPLPLSPRLSGKLSGFRSPTNNFEPGPTLGDRGDSDQVVIDYSVDRQIDTVCTTLSDLPSLDDDSRNDENKVAQDDSSTILNPTVMFKHPTHLITPSEIFMAVSSAEATHSTESKSEGEANIQDVSINSDVSNVEVEVKVVGETGSTQNDEFGLQGESQNLALENKEKAFCSQASDLGIEMAKSEDEVIDAIKDVSGKVADSAMPTTVPQSPAPTTKGKKHKGKNSQVSPSPTAFNSTDSSNEVGANLSSPSVEAAVPHILAMQETLNQLLSMQKEMQKQISVLVAVPVTKEGRRLEATLGRSMEKSVKANADALWANILEENAKHEKLVRDRTQQITSLITNSLNKDLPAILEKTVKKEMAAVVPAVARTITPVVEKTISSAITETFQRGVGDKALNQVEKSINSKLEATVARQIQVQFQTSGKQALQCLHIQREGKSEPPSDDDQDALKSNLEASVVPAFEMSCKAMFDQVDSTFQKGMVEHATTVQQQFESTHSPLALALRDAINSASSMTQTLSGELADGQRKLLALAAAGANPTSVNPLVTQLSNGPLGGLHDKVEMPLDPTKELSRLISERKYEEAFNGALQRSDVSIVSWLCSQVDLQGILSMVPLPLSQGVLLSLLQQLACDINKDTPRKLGWMTDVAVVINPGDPMIAMHVRPIFDQVYQILNHHRSLPTTTSSQGQSIRLLMHVINSMLMTCK